MLGQPFLRNAFLAGAAIAVACGLVGYFVVLRAQVFTGDALSHVAFTGALAALAAGVDLLHRPVRRLRASVALAMAALGRRGRADDTVIGSVFAWILGLGVLFLSIFTTSASRRQRNVRRERAVRLDLRAVSRAGCDRLGRRRRRLRGAGRDRQAAAVRQHRRGGRQRAGGFRSGCSARCSSAWSASPRPRPPRRSAHCCCSACSPRRPAPRSGSRRGRSAGSGSPPRIAVVSVWAGLLIAYAAPRIPPSFGILAVATSIYLIAIAVTANGRRT